MGQQPGIPCSLTAPIARNVGLFRYWTPSNLPLFLLAAPMLIIMSLSSIWALQLGESGGPSQGHKQSHVANPIHQKSSLQVIRTLGIAQLALVLLTLTTAHVQIINRLSSGYPVWMWYVASQIKEKKHLSGSLVVSFVVMHAVVQGGLFASFLPPA